MKRLIKIKDSGKFYLYMGKNVRLTDIKEVGDEIKIIYETPDVKNQIKVVKKDDLNVFVSELLEIDQKPALKTDDKIDNIFTSLSQGLLNDFEKLETDKEYIGQAKQRSNIVNTMINTIKLQVNLTEKS